MRKMIIINTTLVPYDGFRNQLRLNTHLRSIGNEL